MNLQKNNACTPVLQCLDSSKHLKTVKQNTLYSREHIHWKIKLDTAVKLPIAVEKLFKLTNKYSTIIMRPRGMWFQLSAHFCYLYAYTFLPRHMKEQIVVYMEQIWIFWKDFIVFWRFPTKRFPWPLTSTSFPSPFQALRGWGGRGGLASIGVLVFITD